MENPILCEKKKIQPWIFKRNHEKTAVTNYMISNKKRNTKVRSPDSVFAT